jgi:molybdate transport system substrate-binding protein
VGSRSRPWRAVVLVGLALTSALLGGACSSSGAGKAGGRLTVLAAASLSTGLREDAQARVSFGGSQQLAVSVEEGADVDVIVTADQRTMDGLAAHGRVERPAVVASNTLAIAVAPGNPKGVRRLADLARPDVVVVLAHPSVPAGKYAADVLGRAGVQVHPKSLELDVEAAVQKVVLGEADAAIVYATDARARAVGDVPIPTAQNIVTRYVAAVVKTSSHRAAARRYVARLPARLRAAGFSAPDASSDTG